MRQIMTKQSNERPISEAASKNAKRGRPRVFDRENSRALVAVSGRNIQSERGRQNLRYELEALHAMQADLQCAWLAGPDVMSGAKPLRRLSILVELGRIGDEETIRMVGRRVCELKPSAKEGAAYVRQWRTGKQNGGGVRALTMRLANTFDQYRAEHPAMTDDQAREAVRWFSAVVDEIIGDSEESGASGGGG